MDVLQNLLTLPATLVFIIYLILLPVSLLCKSNNKKLSTDMKYAFVVCNVLCLCLNLYCSAIGFEIWEHGTMELVKFEKNEIFGLYDFSKLVELIDAVFLMFFLNKHDTYLLPIYADIPMFLLADYAFNFAHLKPFYGVIFLNSIYQLLMHIYYCISVQEEIENSLKEFCESFINCFKLVEYAVLLIFLIIGYFNYQYSGYNIVGSLLVLVSTFCYYKIVFLICTEMQNGRKTVKREQKSKPEKDSRRKV